MKRISLSRVVAVAVGSIATLFAASARGQPLVDQVPGDAIVYLGWAGADSLGSAYEGSHLKAVLDETKMRDLFGRYLNEAEAKLVQNEPNAKEPFRLLRTLGAPMWKYPAALYVGTPDFSNPQQPKFHVAMLSRAGADAKKLSDEINKLLGDGPKGPVPVHAAAVGNILVFSIGFDSPELALAESSKSLAKQESFSSALKQVSAQPVTIGFVNAEAIVGSVEKALESQQPEAAEKVATFLDASGLRAAKAFITTGGFDGKDWVDQAFLAAPGERTGVFTACPTGPADASLLKTVPADATFFVSSRFDSAKFIKSLRDAVGKTDEQGLQYFNMGLNGLQQALGTNVLENILEPLGTDWVIYSSPRTGAGLLGMVAVNKLDDAEKFKKSANTAAFNLANWINIGIRKGSNGNPNLINVHTATTKIGDVDITYFALPIVAPAWAIKDGRLYLGLYPQTVGAAARQASKGGASLVDSDKYKALIKRLGHDSPDSSSFLDLETSAKYGGMYPQVMLLARYAGFGDLFGLTLPEPLLPPIDALIDQLSPAGSVTWSDAAGYHKKSVTPFPGANLVSEQGAVMMAGVGGGALGTSILLPSLNRARETANRVKSASNLRQIGMGMMLYANENRGKYPADFGELIAKEDLVAEVFNNPRADNEKPPVPDGRDVDAVSKYVNQNSDYVYVGAGLTNSAPADAILAYEKPDGLRDGINILFGDGHVEFVRMDQAMPMVEAAQNARGGGL